MLAQVIKKENKSLESLYEGLEFIQEACKDQSVAEGMKKQLSLERHVGLADNVTKKNRYRKRAKRRRCLTGEGNRCRRADRLRLLDVLVLQRLLQNTLRIVNAAEEVVLKLVDVELPEWKRRQQLACVGAPLNTSLGHLQDW